MEVKTINETVVVNNEEEEDREIPEASTTLPTVLMNEKKLADTTQKMDETPDVGIQEPSLTCHRFIDMAVLANVFRVVACTKCNHTLTLAETKK